MGTVFLPNNCQAEVSMMTRFALCTAVHTEVARRIMQTDDNEMAAAVGHAFARLYAILKNARRSNNRQPTPSKAGFIPTAIAPEREENQLPTYQLGRITFKVDLQTKRAWVRLGDKWVDGLGWKGLSEIAKLPDEVRKLVENLPDDALTNERKAFEFYRMLRDRLGL
jgi:hypothetical protein